MAMNNELLSQIDQIVEELFEKTKLRVLGPNFVSDEFLHTIKDFNPSATISSIYLNAFSNQSIGTENVNSDTINKISEVFSGYIDSLKEKTKNQLSTTILNYQHDAEIKAKLKDILVDDYLATKPGQSVLKQMKDTISEIFTKTDNHLKMLVSNEYVNTQNLGALDGLMGIAKSLDIDDPIVFKLGVIDDKMCYSCRKLWHTEENINIPKLYKLSELKGGYNTDKKNPEPTLLSSHPFCRHSLAMLMPGFGFDESGKVIWVGQNHSEYEKQK